jgi:oligopeptide transport system substrate-binding protein
VETVEVIKEVEVVKEVPAEPTAPDAGKVKLDTVIGTETPSLDPALATDSGSIFLIRQLFMGLTGFDSEANVIPALATEWNVSEDGLTWTFKMRDDVRWVNRNPSTGEFTDIGPVTAQDVEYGVKRTLDPNTASDYAYVLYDIDGAEAFNTITSTLKAEDEEFQKLRDGVGVKAVDDTTVEFKLAAPAAYFPSIAAMWVTFPQPQAAIEQWGNNWTEAGLIVTNGAYTLREWTHGASLMLEKNPLWIDAANVQIELFGGPIIQEASTAMTLFENNEIDIMSDPPGWGPPLPDMDRIKADEKLSKELLIAPQLCTYYYRFVNSKPPFYNVMLRKAFAAAIDRQSLIDNVVKGGQLPAHSFAPPGIFGTVAGDTTIGSFMVEGEYADRLAQAQEWIAEAGYPEGEGLDLLLMHNTSEAHAQIAQAVQAMWKEAFPKANITIENQEWAVYLKTLLPDAPVEEKPDVYRLGWCADYPDSNNWLNEVFNSKSGQNYAT